MTRQSVDARTDARTIAALERQAAALERIAQCIADLIRWLEGITVDTPSDGG